MTEIFGTVASLTAAIILAPARMMPWRSTLVPIMKPGTSARYRSGMLKASHSQMKRAALSAESTNSTPPFYLGWLATMPTARPSMRAKPVTISRAKSFLISSNEPSSMIASMTAIMSKDLFWSAGMISRAVLALRLRAGAPRSPERRSSQVLRHEREVATRASAIASSSVLHEHVAAARDRAVHLRAAHLLERHLLADDHLGHARRAEVHGGVAVDHDHDVAERRDVRAARRRRARRAGRSAGTGPERRTWL